MSLGLGVRRVIDEVGVGGNVGEARGNRWLIGALHWSALLTAQRLGISWNIQPHRVETFKFSTDSELEAKLRDVVGLYLDPLRVRWSVSMRNEIQALDRTQPILPLRQGIPEQQTHDCIRNGTNSLFADLELATGNVAADACCPRHTYTEFLAFLKLVAKSYNEYAKPLQWTKSAIELLKKIKRKSRVGSFGLVP